VKPSPPLFPLFLAVAAAACVAAGFATGAIDVGAWLARQVAKSSSTLTPEVAAQLQPAALRATLLQLAALLTVAAIAAWRLRPAWLRWLGSESPPMAAAAGPTWPIALVAALAIGVRFGATLPHGFFRYDDFELLAVAHATPWWQALWLPHGDHFLPLTRLPAAAAYALFGVVAWPYNLGALLSLWAALVLGAMLLTELRISRAAHYLFLVLAIGWSPWAELMAGYYILSSYTAIATLGFAAIWAYRRWRDTASRRHASITIICTITATLIDVSGWYVPAALAVFLAADLFTRGDARSWFATHRGMLIALGVAALASLACALLAYAVMHPGTFLRMGDGGTRSLGQLVADFLYLFDVGLLGSLAVPYVYARLPTPLLIALAIVAALVGAWFTRSVYRAAGRAERITLIALAAVIAGTCLMVNLGRPSGEAFVVRWATKHVLPGYLWLCLGIAAGWSVCWIRASGRRRVLLAESTLIALVAFCGVQTAFGKLGLAVPFPPFGYPAEIRDAVTRRQAIETIRTRLIAPLRAESTGPIVAPTLDGACLRARWPSLFEYNLSHYAPFFVSDVRDIQWVRTAAMQPWHTRAVATVPVLREAVSPAFLVALAREPTLREFYFASVPLRATPVAAKVAPPEVARRMQPRWSATARSKSRCTPADSIPRRRRGSCFISNGPTHHRRGRSTWP